jgi:hypothetical protein
MYSNLNEKKIGVTDVLEWRYVSALFLVIIEFFVFGHLFSIVVFFILGRNCLKKKIC